MTNRETRETVLAEMNNMVKDYKIISLREAANRVGITHIKTDDCKTILGIFCKDHPEYKAYHMVRDEHDTITSLFCGAVVSMYDIDGEDD
jgi:hypothetical protein